MENKVKFFAGGANPTLQFCPKMKLVRTQNLEKEQEMSILPTKTTIFRAGNCRVKSQVKKMVNLPRYVTPQNLSRGDLAWKIFENMQVLSQGYGELAKLDEQFSDIFTNFQSELDFVTASMRKLAQNLSRGRRVEKSQNLRFANFCSGLSETLVLQNKIMTDLRRLQCLAENFSTQVVIIYLAIQSQNQTTQSVADSVC